MKAITTTRQIGPIGTAARLIVGTAGVVSAIVMSRTWTTILIALAIPALITGLVLLRGPRARPLRAHAPYWHCVNIGIGVFLFWLNPAAALLFLGGSMLIAAWRGFGACEVLAVSNFILRRDDQLACPLFLPIDSAEARSTGRELYCS